MSFDYSNVLPIWYSCQISFGLGLVTGFLFFFVWRSIHYATLPQKEMVLRTINQALFSFMTVDECFQKHSLDS